MQWTPDSKLLTQSNLARAMQAYGHASYDSFHRWSIQDREGFWTATIERLGILFDRPYERIIDSLSARTWRWLPGAMLNITESCFQTPPSATMLVQGSEAGDRLREITHQELRTLVNRISNGLVEAGFKAGDRIAIDMPMTSEAVAIYLGIIQAGMSVVSIADSFSTPEIARRLAITGAKAVFTVDHMRRGGKLVPIYSKVCQAEAPLCIVVPLNEMEAPSLRSRDRLWHHFLSDTTQFTPLYGPADRESNILFSSGTTGDPKAIPWTQLTPIKAASDGYYHQNIQPGDVVCMPTNLGWMMGPWLLYAAFINKASIALYDGAAHGEDFARFLERAHVNVLGLIPSLVRSWRQTGCLEKVDLTALKLFTSTGECSHPDDYAYLMRCTDMRAPIIEYCGGTEVGGAYLTSTVLHTQKPSTFPVFALGSDAVIAKGLDETGAVVPAQPGESGEAYLVAPALGLSETLLNKDHWEAYYADCPQGPDGELLRRHGDQIRVEDGFYRHQGRADDTMNLGGIKVGSADLETVINRHPAVKESAAVAMRDAEGGPDRLLVYVVLGEDVDLAGLKLGLQERIRDELNPLFKIAELRTLSAAEMPRTASGKVQRRLLAR
ncbi:MAG: AMP-binding protein [Chlamydiia bacterium]|nr:AMP-binding protein [Chlamydiia bacterium]